MDNTDFEGLRDENAELRERVADLEKRLERSESLPQRFTKWRSVAVLAIAGPELRGAFKAWVEAKTLRDPLPADETADVAAAIVRRVTRVSLAGLAVAILPTVLLIWQNWEMRKQRELFSQQLEEQRAEAQRQAEDTEIVRRAQLLATIYDCADEQSLDDEGNPPKICKPAAHPRARKEAAEAFVMLENGRGARINLEGADLANVGLSLEDADLIGVVLGGAYLKGVDLSGADLRDAELWFTDLGAANLRGVDLKGANLSSAALWFADLTGSDLKDADLTGVDLYGVNLTDVNLSGADFRGADLSSADFSETSGLTQDQIDSAYGNAETKLPEGLTHPPHWLQEQ